MVVIGSNSQFSYTDTKNLVSIYCFYLEKVTNDMPNFGKRHR